MIHTHPRVNWFSSLLQGPLGPAGAPGFPGSPGAKVSPDLLKTTSSSLLLGLISHSGSSFVLFLLISMNKLTLYFLFTKLCITGAKHCFVEFNYNNIFFKIL